MPPAGIGGAAQQPGAEAPFMSMANFKFCEGVFRAYMLDKHGVRIPPEGDGAERAKRALFRVMEDLQRRQDAGELEPSKLKDMNNLALNAARDVLLAGPAPAREPPRAPPPPPPPPQLHAHAHAQAQPSAVERDRDVFGDRRVVAFQDALPAPGAPGAGAARNREVERRYDAAAAARKSEGGPAAPPPLPWQPAAPADEALGADEFQQRVAEMERERERQAQVSRDLLPPPPGSEDGAAVQRAAMRDQDRFREMQAAAAAAAAAAPIGNERARALIAAPPRAQRAVVERYLSINGGDRDASADPQRYRFTVSMRGYAAGDMGQAHRDVEWIEASCVVVPMEAALPAGADRGFHQWDFGLAYPYLVLAVDGMEGTYDGTSEAVRRAFCVLRYRRAYRTPNGRGFVVLEPMQGERRTFAPAPLAQLGSLRVSLLRPNGALFNNSADRSLVSALEYDPLERLYLTLVLDRFYDPNEFAPGDLVTVAGFRSEGAAGDPDPDAYGALDAFLNRPEGHEVVRVAPANDQGFSRKLVVLAPGVLDQGAGVVVIDGRIVRAVQQLGAASAPAAVAAPGRLVNASLQCVVSLKLGERSGVATGTYGAPPPQAPAATTQIGGAAWGDGSAP